MSATYDQSRYLIEDKYREQILAWLEANGIDPKRVPAGSRATVVDGVLTIPMKVQTSDGRDVLEPADNHGVAFYTATVPVTVPPSPDVELWLQPRCETCGR